ncbi:MAG: hypothetical protein V8S56_05545 [Lachnospiraceae bacterium]
MKKRVLALILASVITLTNGNIAFAAEAEMLKIQQIQWLWKKL